MSPERLLSELQHIFLFKNFQTIASYSYCPLNAFANAQNACFKVAAVRNFCGRGTWFPYCHHLQTCKRDDVCHFVESINTRIH